MAYAPMDYTTGNWHVKETTVFTPTATYPDAVKSIGVYNIDYAKDLSLCAGSTSDKALMNSTQNSELTNALRVDFNKSKIANIYESVTAFKKDSITRLAKKDGLKGQIRVDIKYHVDNTVSGEEGDLLQSAWIVLETQNHPAVTADMTRHTLAVLNGLLTATDGNDASAQFNAIFQGDLDPTR